MRLAKLKVELGDALDLRWKSFLLRPYPRERSLEKFRRYTETWKVPAGQPDGGEFRVWSTDEDPPTHSVPPNVAVKAAARQGAFDRYHLALMRAYFYENRNVTDPETLLDVAVACGLDAEEFGHLLADESVGAEVIADHNEAVSLGISGVPTVVVDDELQIPGAQDLAFYRHVVERRRAMVDREGRE